MTELVVLDEAGLRTPEFTGGAAVKLADGQTWFFPKPTTKIRPTFKDGVAVEMTLIPSFGPKVDGFIDRMRDSSLDDEEFGYARLRFTAAAILLLQNYDLTDELLGKILELSFTDPDLQTMWAAIDRVLYHVPADYEPAAEPAEATE